MLKEDFLFGAATSAYQIEGAWNEDGKTPSIWDTLSHKKGYVMNGHTGDIACDHYHKWKEDIKLMKELGVNAYRFSISWSRICTNKCLCSNLKGIEFYRNIVKELKKANIEPFVTLYHWDLPEWLNNIGGWSNPKSIEYFSCFAQTMFDALPDVKYWITFNEPAVFVSNHWGLDKQTPAIKNILLANGKVNKLYKEKHNGKIGISLNLIPFIPYDIKNKNDVLVAENFSKRHNGIWLDPIFNGVFPKGINKLLKTSNKLSFTDKEKKIVKSIPDFLGINYYTGAVIKYDEEYPLKGRPIHNNVEKDEMGTEIRPYGIYILTKNLKEKYGNLEMYITENGCAYTDTLTHDNRVHDYRRIKYIKNHLYYIDKAIKNGINIKGYFYWSFMDNFEWRFGYTKRFGLVYIHYPTLERIPKDSCYWYKKIIVDKKYRDEEI